MFTPGCSDSSTPNKRVILVVVVVVVSAAEIENVLINQDLYISGEVS